MTRVEEDQKIQIQQATDIVDLVGEQLQLQSKGREYVGLCPFHDDHRPSLQVSPAKQIYKCFSCNAGGDVFSWMTNYHKMTFPEALRFLAERAGIKLRSVVPPLNGGPETSPQNEQIADANAKALAFFQALLHHGEHGKVPRQYLADRGVSEKMVEAFGIGYAPDRWDGLAQMIEAKGWSLQAFRQAGLITNRTVGEGDYDRFRHRLIFPIWDGLGRPVAFGGRQLPDSTINDKSEAKYLNSPETVLFNKSATLYGLHLAKRSIIASREVVVVEGYTDVIACHQVEHQNVVAALGTALTATHVQQIRRIADRVVLVFDADEAGQRAADRAVEIFFASPVDVGVVILPDGMDPAELMSSTDGPACWQRLIAAAVDALEYQFARIRHQFEAEKTLSGRQRLCEDYIRRLAQMGLGSQSIVRRAMVVQKLAELLHIQEHQVDAMLKQQGRHQRRQVAPQDAKTMSGPAPDGQMEQVIGRQGKKNRVASIASADSVHKIKAVEVAELQLIGGLLIQPNLLDHALFDGRTLAEAVSASTLLSANAKRLYDMIKDRASNGQPMTLAVLLAELTSSEEQELCNLVTAAEIEVDRLTDGDDQLLVQIVSAAARAIVELDLERDHRQACAEIGLVDFSDGPVQGNDQLWQRICDHQKNHPSVTRIARFNTGSEATR
tara:strand:- start:1395 stop:3395 length:2001 start_codon:yes stop_codon:yes gene_type:complete